MSAKIKDIQEFCKIFRIRIPWEQEFDYYIETMSKSAEYAHLPELVEDFIDLEKYVARQGISVGSYKMDKLRRLKDYMLETAAIKGVQNTPFEVRKGRQDNLSRHKGRFLVSIDMEKANYNIFRSFDTAKELPAKWEDLIKKLNIHPLFGKSKSWRQLAFGALEPKATQRSQHAYIQGLWDRLEAEGFDSENLLLTSNDELVLATSKMKTQAKKAWAALARITAESLDPDGLPEVPNEFRGKIPLKLHIFKMRPLENGMYVQEEYSPDLTLLKTSLFGVPGNRFFIEFKRNILEEPLDDRDLYFVNEHRLAKWMMDEEGNHIK